MSSSAFSRRRLLSAATTTAVSAATATAIGGLAWSRPLPAAAAASAPPAPPSADPAHRWVAGLYDVVQAEGLTPPGAARFYAYCMIAMYEGALQPRGGYRSLAGQLNGLTPASLHPGRTDAAVRLSAAVDEVWRGLLPAASAPSSEALAAVHQSVRAERLAARVPQAIVNRSLEEGRRLGQHLLRWIADDGWAQIQGRPYTPPVGESNWVSTPPNFGTAIEPYWEHVRPMVMLAADEVTPEPHVPFSSAPGSAFHAEAMATYDAGRQLTDEQRAIARFWTDNPRVSGLPSGHWLLLVGQAAGLLGLGLAAALEAYVRAGITLHDAFLSCWTVKYRLNLLRPVTYVQRHIDPSWATFVNTPQFPEYTSGHSVASGAAATVLTDLLGSFAFVDDSHAPRGLPARSFTSFEHAAQEAAISRLYGGIHYPMGITGGLAQGREIGALVTQRLRTRS